MADRSTISDNTLIDEKGVFADHPSSVNDGPKGPADRGRSAPHTLESAPTLADFPDFRTNPTEIRQGTPD